MQNSETHNVCENRLKKEGGKAKCCDCNPHDGCNLRYPKEAGWEERLWDLMYEEYGDVGKNGKIKQFIQDLLETTREECKEGIREKINNIKWEDLNGNMKELVLKLIGE